LGKKAHLDSNRAEMDSQGELKAVVKAAIDGATVLTGNTRAARFLLSECDRLLAQNEKAWSTPDILPLGSWVQRCFRDAQVSGVTPLVLLNQRQNLALWKHCITDSPGLTELLGPASASGQAALAWGQIQAYRIPLDSHLEATAQSKAFYSWAKRYQSVSARNHWTEQARVADELKNLIRTHRIKLAAQQIHLWECGELNPQLAELIAATEHAGVKIVRHDLARDDWGHARKIACDDSEAELRRAAAFSRNILVTESESRVGIVVPKLRELRSRVETIFTEVLHPEFYVGEEDTRAFEISLGEPLASRPIIKAAVLMLQFLTQELSFQEVRELLMSRYLGGSENESGDRARLCRWLTEKAPEQISLQRLLRMIDPASHSGRDAETLRKIAVPHLRKTLAKLAGPKGFPTKAGMSDWATTLGRLIGAAGWPAHKDVQLNSSDFQSYKKWLELLSELASLDVAQGPLTLSDAVEEITRAAASQTFSPENLGARVQIMDDAEAAGTVFDHLWICGLDDETWPPRKSGSAFIPAQLLRDAKVPGSTPESQVEDAERAMRRLLGSADRAILSYPLQDGERKLRRSPALRDAEEITWEDLKVQSPECWSARVPTCTMEELQDDIAPAIVNSDLLHRGSSLLEKQSACPFRAFAELRLSASEVREPTGGIEAIVRGNLIEDVLKAFWREARNLRNYRGLPEADRRRLIENAVEEALLRQLGEKDTPADLTIREIERERLIALTEEWLQLEDKREDFDDVRHQQEFAYRVAGVELRGRIDRIDRSLTQLGAVIIDYKSGTGSNYSRRAWEQPRPRMPQLPLYAVQVQSEGNNVVGLGFGILTTAKSKFEGIATSNEVFGNNSKLPKWAKPTLPEQIRAWAEEIERLVKEHLAGDARVDPKVPPSRSNSTCGRCHLHAMCRVSESVGIDGDDEEDSDE
jgi:ATP-dependent helicase/nuclease subunit B